MQVCKNHSVFRDATDSQRAMAFVTGCSLFPSSGVRASSSFTPSATPSRSGPFRRPRHAIRACSSLLAADRKLPDLGRMESRNLDGSVVTVDVYDAVVIGGGPAGLSLASRLCSEHGLKVLVSDPGIDKTWPNNYGVWYDDMQALGYEPYLSHVWDDTAVYASASKKLCNKRYARLDRVKLKAHLLSLCDAHADNIRISRTGVCNIDEVSNSELSYVYLGQIRAVDDSDNDNDNDDSGNDDNGSTDHQNLMDVEEKVAARVVIDCSGYSNKFTQYGRRNASRIGFQAAYGVECILKQPVSDVYSPREMLLMDFRDDHMQASAEDRETSQSEPTFVYVMPLDADGRHVFFEETSLVMNPAMDFGKLRDRLHKRLSYYGIEVSETLDEEHCLIPMGGAAPSVFQRTVAFGGSAALVHPATGYMVSRMLLMHRDVAASIAANVQTADANIRCEAIWRELWSDSRLEQRDFYNFGGWFLQTLSLDRTREFFDAFFKLPSNVWFAYLTFALNSKVDRLLFGLAMFVRTSNENRLSLVAKSLSDGGVPFFNSVLPFPSFMTPDTE